MRRKNKMSRIRKIKNNIKKTLVSDVARKVVSWPFLQKLIENMNDHFNIRQYKPWPLGYDEYKQDSGLSEMEFNILLESLNYKLFYDRNSGSIVFKPGK